jgi:hypothetical protein
MINTELPFRVQGVLPFVGGPATIYAYSDRYPGTVQSVTDKEIIITEDKYERIDNNGMSESQEYEYTSNPYGRRFVFRKVRSGRCRGQWRENGLTTGMPVNFSYRQKYYNPSF